MTPAEYLAIERTAEIKSEFFEGEMFAMSGGTDAHNRLVWNATAELGRQLRSDSCQGYPSDMLVRVSATGLYTYPDLTIVCGEPQFADERRDTLVNPSVIIEVLSRSTEAYDRGRKFEHYSTIASLEEYVLVASDRVRLDLYTRQAPGQWLRSSCSGLEDTLELKSPSCRLSLAELYRDVNFA